MSSPPTPTAEQDLRVRLAGIRKMRLVATGLLAVATLVFAGTFAVGAAFPAVDPFWLGAVRAFAEAAMVGAIADWFAVVALFRHPLGIPIPHTAIIPHKHARIAAAIGRFVAENLLASAAMAQRLEELDPSGRMAHWLEQPDTAWLIAKKAGDILPPILEAIGEDRLRRTIGVALRSGIDMVITPSRMSGILSFAASQNYHQSLLDLALDAVGDFVARHEGYIRAKVSERCGDWVPLWVETRLADSVINGISESLGELRKQDHPQRKEINDSFYAFIAEMADSPEFVIRLDDIKAQIMDDPAIEGYLEQTWQGLYSHFAAESSALEAVVLQGVQSLSLRLKTDQELRASVNRWLRETAERLLIPRREFIGTLIADLIMRWRTESLVDRLESHVGQDLQYIRINGTIVGGAAGTVIYLISTALTR